MSLEVGEIRVGDETMFAIVDVFDEGAWSWPELTADGIVLYDARQSADQQIARMMRARREQDEMEAGGAKALRKLELMLGRNLPDDAELVRYG